MATAYGKKILVRASIGSLLPLAHSHANAKALSDAILNSVNCISHIQQGNFFWEENFNFQGGEKKISGTTSCLDHEQVRSEK